MDDAPKLDLISNLPLSIIESILVRLPIREAVRTSILSSKWRYRWSGITDLVFEDDLFLLNDKLKKFITQVLLLHAGPIHKFQITTSNLRICPDIDQWILFLSRNDVKEILLELGECEWFTVPSCLFSCQKIDSLGVAIQSLVSSCPLLECLSLSYFDSLALNISAPNLKYLFLEGEFKEICLENTPGLVSVTVAMYMSDDVVEHFEQSSSCNFIKFFGGAPHLERLIGHIYFTKFLSIGNELGRHPITYHHLKNIELYQVSFEDIKEILVILRLIIYSPNLEELQISGSSNTSVSPEVLDLDFWENECPLDCAFKCLQTVKMTDISGLPHEMRFIKFLLENSPILEIMSITPSVYAIEGRMHMVTELLEFRRVSPQAKIKFVLD
ncbi:F-box/FBD/LRR-repeat protein [Vitis vinifera]|uniref:F-box/FBD/LRR-repeat protein n=1 Tax=Vitis vinifera TaxID=29760 RepID=A0A438EA40_VITVI|nr:F-box/FBD/LRR-repeat protein [Vitis vinifera]